MKSRLTAFQAHEVANDKQYKEFEDLIHAKVGSALPPFFRTATSQEILWALYLSNLPLENRQHYNCHACRQFIEKYGGLVKVNPSNGKLKSVLWDETDVPDFFKPAVKALREHVENSYITGYFEEHGEFWGKPQTGDWTHLSGQRSKAHRIAKNEAEAHQIESVINEKYGMLLRGLAEYSKETIEQAIRLLKSDALYRSEKGLRFAEWLLERKKEQNNRNLLWLATSITPENYCHVKASVVSTLLDDITLCMPLEVVQKRWAEKLHPLQYQRPSSPPKDGAITQAEKLVAEKGLQRSFERRAATLSDVQEFIWTPPLVLEEPKEGFFAHLRKQPEPASYELPSVDITWEKFKNTVLPNAREIEIMMPTQGAFYGLVTAENPSAPPIIQWDREDRRNPVSWYYYHGGSSPYQWNLYSGCWAPVKAIFNPPYKWGGNKASNFPDKLVFFALYGCYDKGTEEIGSALFPEILKSELHPIRSVIEAHSKESKIHNKENGTANGISFGDVNPKPLMVRVKDTGGWANYKLDRWD